MHIRSDMLFLLVTLLGNLRIRAKRRQHVASHESLGFASTTATKRTCANALVLYLVSGQVRKTNPVCYDFFYPLIFAIACPAYFTVTDCFCNAPKFSAEELIRMVIDIFNSSCAVMGYSSGEI